MCFCAAFNSGILNEKGRNFLKSISEEKTIQYKEQEYTVNLVDYAKLSDVVFGNKNRDYNNLDIDTCLDKLINKCEIVFDKSLKLPEGNTKEQYEKIVKENIRESFKNAYEVTKNTWFLQKIDLINQGLEKESLDNGRIKIIITDKEKNSYRCMLYKNYTQEIHCNYTNAMVENKGNILEKYNKESKNNEWVAGLQHEFGHFLYYYVVDHMRLEDYFTDQEKEKYNISRMENEFFKKIFEKNESWFENKDITDEDKQILRSLSKSRRSVSECLEVLGLFSIDGELYCDPFSEVAQVLIYNLLLPNTNGCKRGYNIFYHGFYEEILHDPDVEAIKSYLKLLKSNLPRFNQDEENNAVNKFEEYWGNYENDYIVKKSNKTDEEHQREIGEYKGKINKCRDEILDFLKILNNENLKNEPKVEHLVCHICMKVLKCEDEKRLIDVLERILDTDERYVKKCIESYCFLCKTIEQQKSIFSKIWSSVKNLFSFSRGVKRPQPSLNN